MAALTHDQLVAAFEARFAYLTARTMLSEVLDNAGLTKSNAYDAAALAKVTLAVEKVVARPTPVLQRLNAGPVAAVAPAPVAAPAPAPVEVAPVAAAPAAPETAAEAPPAEAPAAEAAPAAEEGHADKHTDKKGKKKEG